MKPQQGPPYITMEPSHKAIFGSSVTIQLRGAGFPRRSKMRIQVQIVPRLRLACILLPSPRPSPIKFLAGLLGGSVVRRYELCCILCNGLLAKVIEITCYLYLTSKWGSGGRWSFGVYRRGKPVGFAPNGLMNMAEERKRVEG